MDSDTINTDTNTDTINTDTDTIKTIIDNNEVSIVRFTKTSLPSLIFKIINTNDIDDIGGDIYISQEMWEEINDTNNYNNYNNNNNNYILYQLFENIEEAKKKNYVSNFLIIKS